VALNKLEQALHLAMVVNIFRENILAQWVPRRAMHEEERPHPVGTRQIAEKLPTPLVVGPVRGVLKLAAGPEDGSLGADVEPVRIEHRALIVVTQQGCLAGVHDSIDALAGVWAVADDIAQAKNF